MLIVILGIVLFLALMFVIIKKSSNQAKRVLTLMQREGKQITDYKEVDRIVNSLRPIIEAKLNGSDYLTSGVQPKTWSTYHMVKCSDAVYLLSMWIQNYRFGETTLDRTNENALHIMKIADGKIIQLITADGYEKSKVSSVTQVKA